MTRKITLHYPTGPQEFTLATLPKADEAKIVAALSEIPDWTPSIERMIEGGRK